MICSSAGFIASSARALKHSYLSVLKLAIKIFQFTRGKNKYADNLKTTPIVLKHLKYQKEFFAFLVYVYI